MCKFNAGGRVVPTISHCSTNANLSVTDDWSNVKNSSKPAWLATNLKMMSFKVPHYTHTTVTGHL